MNKILLFQYGIEGGSAKVYSLSDNKVLETGSSGGVLDETEDPVLHWEKEFESWSGWWDYFMEEFKSNWIKVNPIFIHPDIKDYIKSELSKFQNREEGIDFYIEVWNSKLY